MDRELFEAVQAKLTEQWSHRTATRNKSAALLSGLLFDDAGHPMIPTHCDQERRPLSVLRVAALSSRAGKVVFELGRPGACGGHRSRGDQGACSRISAIGTRHNSGSEPDGSQHDRGKRRSNRGPQEPVGGSAQIAERRRSFRDRPETERDLQTSSGDTNGSLLLIPWCKPPSQKVSRDPAATVCLTSGRPPHQGRATNGTAQVHRAWPRLAGRDRLGGVTGCRADRCASQMQRPSRQYDDLNGLHRSGPRQGRGRGSPPPRHWRGGLARCAGRVVTPVRTAGPVSTRLIKAARTEMDLVDPLWCTRTGDSCPLFASQAHPGGVRLPGTGILGAETGRPNRPHGPCRD